MDTEPIQPLRSTTHRWIGGIVGCLLVAVAAVAFVYFDAASRTLPLIAAIGIAALGVDAIIAALRNRRSTMDRLGPLP